jgi:hypothetical protein
MTKTKKIIYWIATIWMSFGMVSGGIMQLLKVKGTVDGLVHLGYPLYLLYILGVWKILGVIAMLVPKYPLIKEWAYAGFFFLMSGALYSHIANGDGPKECFGAVLMLVLIGVSWYFRPADRKLV